MIYKNILFIDDDADDLELIKSAMEIISPTQAYSTISSAIKALDMLETKRILPDLIFLDLNMPVLSGQQFLEELKHKEGLKDLPVFILSTTSNPSAIKNTKELGATGFITKPMKFSDLVASLRSVILG